MKPTKASGGKGITLVSMLTVSLVPFLDLIDVPPAFDDIVIELIPASRCSDLGTREAGERMECESVDCKTNAIDAVDSDGDAEEGQIRRGYCHLGKSAKLKVCKHCLL